LNTDTFLPSVRRLNYHYFAMQAGFWSMFASICGYQAALLLGRGFTSGQVGLIIAVRCVAGILCQPVLGGFADRHPEIPLKRIIAVSLCVSLCAGTALMLIPMGLGGVMAVFFVIGAFEVSAYPFVDSMAIQYINAGVPIRYSVGRGIGSMSYAVISVVLGRVAGRWGVEAVLPVHTALVLAEIAIISLYPTFRSPPRHAGQTAEKPRSAFALLRDCPRFTLMLAALFFGISGVTPLSNFLVNIVTSRGGSVSALGLALFLMAGSELPIAFLFPRLLRRLGSIRLLFISICFMALKCILLLCAGSLTAVLVIQPIQMLGYGLFASSSVFFVNDSVPEADRVRGQTLMMVASNGLGGVAGNLLAGQVLDKSGVTAMLLLCTLCCCAGMVLSAAAVRLVRPDSDRN